MEPLGDRELDKLLAEWRAPAPPATLEQALRRAQRPPRWRWLLTGTVRVPVPVAALVLLAFVMIFVIAFEYRAAHHAPGGEFRPVKEMQVRVIRSSYEINH
jgi:hypothetical protein